ncbi:MAG TPA: phosphoribosylformylglycinamidine synthase [Bacteroidales bacterium]|nr:phosphoribosylformylglycinamidine synthase [Bacteroidales bacterium]
MILFFQQNDSLNYAVHAKSELAQTEIERLKWLFGNAEFLSQPHLDGFFIGPRKEMITPWSTNAVEITQNMGITGILRIEEFIKVKDEKEAYDPMLQALYRGLDQEIFTIDKQPEPVIEIEDIASFNEQEGLALSEDEVQYLEDLSHRLGRKLTDSEVFGFSQVNSEHCRHKIFNGTFIINGKEMPESLFGLIKKTSKTHPNRLVSAYKDNVAFVLGPKVEQFAPATQDTADFFEIYDIDTVLSLKAETHNFPTTVEPFNGAATGTGGEIRDRMAGGKGSLPLSGTAVYMTSYSRSEEGREWEKHSEPRPWLYQTPEEILIKASNGASDFGNKFGQPLICGSVLTFEHFAKLKKYGYDKVIMLAGGIGFGKKDDAQKDDPGTGDRVIVMGGDNYRIGMGGGAVSSVATGEYDNAIELNAVQRSNPEMQKRVYNAIRAMAELKQNPVISIHDHGAGGHLNSLSELVEVTGGMIDLRKLPIGDPTLSAKEIVGNESQERMGLLLKKADVDLLKRISDRERAPMYDVGETTGDHRFTFDDKQNNNKPIDLELGDMFGNPPKTVLEDTEQKNAFAEVEYDPSRLQLYLKSVLQMEAVACKDWLTNKVDRSVTGKVAFQQTCGEVQLPLNNLGVSALDYQGIKGVATAIGHAPVAGLVDPEAGSRLSIAESLTNILWAPIEDGLKGISLSANWMWPAKNPGENARLYKAVQAISDFAIELGINIPTGKDSLSMTQKYKDDVVFSPGTVIISTVGEVSDIRKIISPALKPKQGTSMIYIDLSRDTYQLGGSSFAQLLNKLGTTAPTVKDSAYFAKGFNVLQQLIKEEKVMAGHDISAGGLITALLEMCFPSNKTGLEIDLTSIGEKDTLKLLFSENPAVLIQVENAEEITEILSQQGIQSHVIAKVLDQRTFTLKNHSDKHKFDLHALRDSWFKTSYLLDRKQCGPELAKTRFDNFEKLELNFDFGKTFTGKASQFGIDLKRRKPTGIKAAIIREKGVNGDREMAWSLYMAGFDVKDVHMTDLIAGRETLKEINMIVFVGGFSNSDVLGSAKGWAGAFLYNEKAKIALDNFYNREDTLSLGICNGCQVMIELGLVNPDHHDKPKMLHNASRKFESAFLSVDIQENNSVMLKSMAGSKLGIWVAHGEGQFEFPYHEELYKIPVKYSHDTYPGNPNGSQFNAAGLCSDDGRHLVMMPHLERAVYPWQWAYYPDARKSDEISPWVEAFVNARDWVEEQRSR